MNKLQKSILVIVLAAIVAIIAMQIVFNNLNIKTRETGSESFTKEYLSITTVAYSNGTNTDDGILLRSLLYNITDDEMTEVAAFPITPGYPISFVDVNNERMFFTDSYEDGQADNLFQYNYVTGETFQLTDGKYSINDIFIADGQLFLNVAGTGRSVTQPAIYDLNSSEVRYLNPDDDDTWCYSLSYNYATDKITSLTCSDTEMRTLKVVRDTHIRHKTINIMDTDFSNYTAIYDTEEFEIIYTRQLDEENFLMAVDNIMSSANPRTLKKINTETKDISDINIPGILEVDIFHIRKNGEGIYFRGRDVGNKISLFYYDFENDSVFDLFVRHPLESDHKSLIDFVYTIQ